MEPDEDLVNRFLGGDESAFETLVERYEARIRKVAFGFVRQRQLAEDIAQETFLQAYRKLSSLGRAEAFRSWLYRIAINRAHDEIRRGARQTDLADDEFDRQLQRGPQPPSGERLAQSAALRRRLSAALAELPKKHRTPLLLKEVEGMTYAEISELLDWPIGTVQIRIHRARLKLRDLLEDLKEEKEP